MQRLPKVRQSNVVVQEIENEILVYDLLINKVFCLNKTAKTVFQLADGTNSVEEISRSLSQKLKEPISEDLVWLALDQLKQHNLLTDNDRFNVDFNGLSRRQMIRKIGLASMVALPVISSVIAPQAIQSQSCQSVGQSCNPTGSVGNCCQGEGYCATYLASNNICVGCGSPNQIIQPCSAGTPRDIAGCNSVGYTCCSGSTTLVPNYPGCDPDVGSFVCVCD